MSDFSDKSPDALREMRLAERNALLQKIRETLTQDERVTATWLLGSLACGDGDALSDIDLWVVLADEAFPAVLSDLPAFVAQIAPPLLTRDEPYNAPTGGAYLTVIYDGATGAHLSDWYFQRQSDARRPPNTRLLFSRTPLPEGDAASCGGNPGVPRDVISSAVQDVNGGWMMLCICAKYAARSPNEPEMGLLPYALNGLNGARGFIGLNSLPETDFAPHPTPQEKIAVLRRVASLLTEASEALANQGGSVAPGIAASASRFLDFIAALIE